MTKPFTDKRSAALALLNGNSRLTIKAGRFLGQVAVNPHSAFSPEQGDWFDKLLDRAGLPPLAEGGAQ